VGIAGAVLLIGLLGLCLGGCAPNSDAQLGALGADVASERTVSVSGSAQVGAQPDVAVVRLGVETRAEQADEALAENNERMQDLIDALQEAGVAEEDIQTQVVQLRPQYPEGPQQAEPEVVGYVASNVVEARVREIENVGQLLDAAVQAGGNRIEGIRFEVSDPTAVLEQAREAAWADAQAKAEQLAELAGAELGAVWSINESGGAPRPVLRAEVAEDAAVPIQPGSQNIEVRLDVTWLLE
jgi:hypothetical protein